MSDSELYAPAAEVAAHSGRSRVIAGGSIIVALALLALVLAHWGWRWFGPPPVTVPPSVPQDEFARRIADAHLFGARAPSAPTSEPTSTSRELRLLGVFAQQNGRGFALFRGARGVVFAAAGSEVLPGVRLDTVTPGGVTLVESGAKREIALRAAAAPDKQASSAVATAKSAACSPPAGFVGQIVRLNAELLGGMLKAPDSWKALVQPGGGGLVVRDQSGFAGMMGLRNGDALERANGIALSLPEDVAGTVLQPLMRSQPVRVSGTRDGRPQQWLYLNAGACPA